MTDAVSRTLAASSSERDPLADRMKGLLIALVVFGHVLEAADPWRTTAGRGALTAIYLFHVPAFAFAAGLTAKTERLGRRLANLAVLLAAFQAVGFLVWLNTPGWRTFSADRPFWTLWFLLALLWWYALLPLASRAPRLAFAASVVAALCAGTIDALDDTLAGSRTVVFLPFFLVGAFWGRALLDRASSLSVRGVVACVCLGAVSVTAGVLLGAERGWLFGSRGHSALDVDFAEGVLMRVALYSIAALAGCALLTSLPFLRSSALERLGRCSLSVYLLHGPLVMLMKPVLRGTLAIDDTLAQWTVCTACALGMVVALSSPGLDRLLRRTSGVAADAIVTFGREGPWQRRTGSSRHPPPERVTPRHALRGGLFEPILPTCRISPNPSPSGADR